MKLRILGPALAVIAIAGGGVVWSGCGDGDNTSTVRDQAERQVEESTKKAEEAIDEGAEKTKKGLEEGRAKAEKSIEEAQEQADRYLP